VAWSGDDALEDFLGGAPLGNDCDAHGFLHHR
jgi:hypothetical protein